MTNVNTIGWFEIGTDDPATAQRFYGEVFGWTVRHDGATSTDPAYRMISTGGLPGGLFDTAGAMPGYAVFTVLVDDVVATCRRIEQAGGAVRRAPQVNPVGVTFAHVTDPAGNAFSVFTPPSAG